MVRPTGRDKQLAPLRRPAQLPPEQPFIERHIYLAATTASATDLICFQVRLAIESATQYDILRFFIVQGATRVQLWDKHQPGFTVIDHPQNPGPQWDLYTTNGNWVEVDVTVGTPPGINLANPVQFKFDFQTVDAQYNRTEGIYLDNIMSRATRLRRRR